MLYYFIHSVNSQPYFFKWGFLGFFLKSVQKIIFIVADSIKNPYINILNNRSWDNKCELMSFWK